MITISFRFLAGRYHATPWDRHVNEGAVEWPPSPWRLLRALIAAAQRMPDPPSHDRLRALLKPLTAPPVYSLPAAEPGHLRTYMPTDAKTVKVFDAFLRLPDRNDELLVRWSDASFNSADLTLIDSILASLTYLGRAESWALAERVPGTSAHEFDVCALDDVALSEHTTRLAVPVSEDGYSAWLAGFNAFDFGRKRPPVPADWYEALTQDTSTLQRAGWSHPPGLRWVRYRLPGPLHRGSAGRDPVAVAREQVVPGPGPSIVRLALTADFLPPLTDALRVGEAMRGALLKVAESRVGADRVPPTFLGRDADGRPLRGQRHAYVLPTSERPDGRIDHIAVYTREPAGFSPVELDILRNVGALYHAGADWRVRCLVTAAGSATDFRSLHGRVPSDGGFPQLGRSRVWQSWTPFVPSRHARPGRAGDDAASQVLREIHLHGLPVPTIEPTDAPPGREALPWRKFRLVRMKGRVQPASTRGHGFRLTFPEPVEGPISLGYAAHQGLGQFVAMPDRAN